MTAPTIDPVAQKFPFCIVWTPIPLLTWIFPFVGHMGIATSSGIIRDFAGPYYVGEGKMAFGKPTRYLKLTPSKALDGERGWDQAVFEASEIYKGRMHNLLCDNCHSHTATALNLARYDGWKSWNMFALGAWMFVRGKYVGIWGFVKTWLPFFVLVLVTVVCFGVVIPALT